MSVTGQAETEVVSSRESKVVVDELTDDEGWLIPAAKVEKIPEGEVVEEERPEAEGQQSLGEFVRTEVETEGGQSPAMWVAEQDAKQKMVVDETGPEEVKYPLSEGLSSATSVESASDEASGRSCPECGSGKTTSQQRQMGGADEAMTGFHHCQECDHRWRTGYGA